MLNFLSFFNNNNGKRTMGNFNYDIISVTKAGGYLNYSFMIHKKKKFTKCEKKIYTLIYYEEHDNISKTNYCEHGIDQHLKTG